MAQQVSNLKQLQRGHIPPALERFRTPPRMLCIVEELCDHKGDVVYRSKGYLTMKQYRKLFFAALDHLPHDLHVETRDISPAEKEELRKRL